MSKVKIAVVANCQGRAISRALTLLSSDIEIINTSVVHLIKNSEKDEFIAAMIQADIIVAQLVNDQYPCEFVRTNYLKMNFTAKVVSIVNLYFTAYSPEWVYLRFPKFGVLRGPMGDYHNEIILSAWKKRLSVSECIDRLDSMDDFYRYRLEANESLKVLRNREKLADVGITDFIEDNYRKNQLFFTFNHPSARVIIEYSKRVLEYKNIPFHKNIVDMGGEEPLNQFCPIVNKKLGLPGSNRACNIGKEIVVCDDNVRLGEKEYSMQELVESFYKVYDSYSDLIMEHPLLKDVI